MDREAQRERSYTGIDGIAQQDMAVTESMGAIYNRTQEHLGTSDRAIISMRRMLIKAARDLANGIEPQATDPRCPTRRSAAPNATSRRTLTGVSWAQRRTRCGRRSSRW